MDSLVYNQGRAENVGFQESGKMYQMTIGQAKQAFENANFERV